PPPREPAPEPSASAHGRVDALTVAAAVFAVGGVAWGTVFGVKALLKNPSATGHYTSYSEYLRQQKDAESAHHDAMLSDVGFVVGGVALVSAAVLFFLRTKDPKASQSIGV